jgi:hypothetical protein
VRGVERHEDKHPERILGEYIAADSPGEWLAEEIGDYLFGEADEESREDGLEQVFQRVDEERRSFVATQLDPHALTQFVLEVERPGRTLRASFSTIPSPLVLLDACIRIAEVGDRVIVEHSYASGDKVTFSGAWPFGMDWAVRATAPLGESLADGSAEEYLGVSGEEDELDEEWEEILQIRLPRPWRVLGAAGAAVAAGASMLLLWRRGPGR